MRNLLLAASLLASASAGLAADPAYVWWEGEKPAKTNFPAKSWFDASTFPDTRGLLSEGQWLSSSGKRGDDELFATYRVAVPAAGEYNLWTRKFWKHGPFRWRFDSSDWQNCGRDCALADDTYLKLHVGANWVHLGKVKLAKGEHTFELRLLADKGQETTACFDCFLLIPGAFSPHGRFKPGERTGLADQGFFAYEPPPDTFSEDALLDLRSLNEPVAGAKGFLKRKGDALTLADGTPTRLWAVNVSAGTAAMDHSSIDYLARKLAKLGVNCVRYHSPLFARGGDPAKIDPQTFDNLCYLVSAMKAQGIYTELSFFFPLWFDVQRGYGIPGYEGAANKKPFAILYFDSRMQEIHRAWLKGLLTTKAPYLGQALAREPALALVEIVNEDSLFFWTLSEKNVPAVQWAAMEKLFADWLAKRYGSLDKAYSAWGGAKDPRDAAGRARVYEAWAMTSGGRKQQSPDRRKRVADQARFLAELQRDFYEQTTQYIRKDLGYGGLVTASNWHTADPVLLDALERWTYRAGDVIDRHGYFGGKHTGDGSGYSVRAGHQFEDRSALLSPASLPIQAIQPAGFPQIISELGWTNPNRLRADATLLAAACCGLQGVDGMFWFAVAGPTLDDGSMHKFPVGQPTVAGAFPAAALMYRRGDVTTPPPAVHEVVPLAKLFALEGSAAQSAEALDELRKADVPAGQAVATDLGEFDPLSFYVGPVVRDVDGKGKSTVRDLTGCIDRKARTVRSATGELSWDYGAGVVRVDTPRSQGAAGFLAKAGPVDLKAVRIECGNEYASILITSLDGKPVAESRRVLIQAVTEDHPHGFSAPGGKIRSMGGPPMNVRKIDAAVTVRFAADTVGAAKPRVVALDENGYATDKPVAAEPQAGGAIRVKLAPGALYHVLTR